MNPSLLISILALAFTVSSFWWIQVRRGRLRCYAPRAYAGCFAHDRVIVSLPLVLYNTGPAPIVVLDFRIRLSKTKGKEGRAGPSVSSFDMSWHAVQPSLEPQGAKDGRLMPSPFPVEGRRAIEKFIEFSRKSPAEVLLDGPYMATVEVRLAHSCFRAWRTLLSFPLHTQLVERDTAAHFIPRSNDPEWTD
jgi:hypothetical protein